MKTMSRIVVLVAVAVFAAAATGSMEVQENENRLSCPSDDWYLMYYDDAKRIPTCITFTSTKQSFLEAEANCKLLGSNIYLAEPYGALHHQVFEQIHRLGLLDEAFWIGGSDAVLEGNWTWIRTGKPMPMGTPHWYPCQPSQPLESTTANYACVWPIFYYYFSCTEKDFIKAICQTDPTPTFNL